MIKKSAQDKKITEVSCDFKDCGIYEEYTLEFDALKEAIAESGWMTLRDGKVWKQACPDCAKIIKEYLI